MEKIMNEENYWDHNVEEDSAESRVVCVGRLEVLRALNKNRNSLWIFRSITRDDCC